MDLNGIERKRNLEVVFIVPIGVDQGIFPWGVNCIKDYVDKTSQEANTHIWDFREDKYFVRAVIDYSDLLSELFLSLKVDQMLRFFSVTFNPYIFFGTVAYAGNNFSKLAGNNKFLKGKKAASVKKLQTETEKHIVDRINSFKEHNGDAQRIWAFSVYDATLFNCLYIASIIKKVDPDSDIVFGGDYFDFNCAEKLMKSVSFIEGAIVGYGEETISTIISKKSQGVCISDLKINGFVNSAYLKAGEGVNELREVNIPSFYDGLSSCAPISYIKQTKPGAFHILSQRGCSWGKCSFCTQIDKHQLYRICNKQLLAELVSAIEAAKTNQIDITFESEEVSFEFASELINELKSYKDRDMQFVIRLWFQVKSFRKELARDLYEIAGDKVTIIFALNFESLNYETLKNMHKGHSPIKAIESAKAVIDTGHIFRSNYLEQFPLENGDSIQEEVSILKRIVHLFIPPRGEMVFFPYSPNNRDEISKNQEKFNITLTTALGDNWLKNAFGVDLPFSIWAFEYKNKLSWDLDSLIYHIYNRSVYYTRWGNIPRECIKYFWGSNKLPFSEHFFFLGRKLRSGVWHILLKIFMGIGLGKCYKERKNILLYLLDAKSKPNNANTSILLIKGNNLIKEYNIPGQEIKWTKSLTITELRILRYLYWTRKISEVVSKFQNEMSEQDIKKFIDHHIELGVIIKFRDTILCTANDPEYWTNNEYKSDIM